MGATTIDMQQHYRASKPILAFLVVTLSFAIASLANAQTTRSQLDSIVIPQVNFSGVELTRVLETLEELSDAYSNTGRGIRFEVVSSGGTYNPKVNISLRNLSLRRIIHFITQQVNCTFSETGNGNVRIFTPHVKPSLADKASQVRKSNPDWNSHMNDYDLVREYLRFHPEQRTTFDIPAGMAASVQAEIDREKRLEREKLAKEKAAAAAAAAARSNWKTEEIPAFGTEVKESTDLPEGYTIVDGGSRSDNSQLNAQFRTSLPERVIQFLYSPLLARVNIVHGCILLIVGIVFSIYLVFNRSKSFISRMALAVGFGASFVVTLTVIFVTSGADLEKAFTYHLGSILFFTIIGFVCPFVIVHLIGWALNARDSERTEANNTEHKKSKFSFKPSFYGRSGYLIIASVFGGFMGGIASFISPSLLGSLYLVFLAFIVFYGVKRMEDASKPKWLGLLLPVPVLGIYTQFIASCAQTDYGRVKRLDRLGITIGLLLFFVGSFAMMAGGFGILNMHGVAF